MANSEKISSHSFELDIFRSLGILVVLLVHSIFWIDLWPEGMGSTIRTFTLIEMPLIFAVSGASNYFSKKNGIQLFSARIKRILIPYWAYAIICVILIADQTGFKHNLLISWLNPFYGSIGGEGRIQVLNWALWFIPVYLLAMIIFPFLKKYYVWSKSRHTALGLLPLAVGIVIVLLHDYFNVFIPNYRTIFYLIFIYWGMVCVGNQWVGCKRIQSFILGSVALVLTIALLLSERYTPNMLLNKDDCNLVFLLYNLFVQCTLNLILPVLKKAIKWLGRYQISRRLLIPFRKNGYTIYLYHPLVFASIPFMLQYIGAGALMYVQNTFFIMGLYFVILVASAAALTAVFGRFEAQPRKK